MTVFGGLATCTLLCSLQLLPEDKGSAHLESVAAFLTDAFYDLLCFCCLESCRKELEKLVNGLGEVTSAATRA